MVFYICRMSLTENGWKKKEEIFDKIKKIKEVSSGVVSVKILNAIFGTEKEVCIIIGRYPKN